MAQDTARAFFENYAGAADSFQPLAQSGSARQNFAASFASQKYIVTVNGNVAENESFFYFTRLFNSLNLNAPQILAVSPERQMYLQSYLGDQTLSEIIALEGESERVEELVKKSLRSLYQLQTKTQGAIDFTHAFEYETYDDLPVSSDLFYFKSFVADILEIPYSKTGLLREFKILSAKVAVLQPRGLMLRDFQSRNIMVDASGDVHFIDYQSAMEGPLMYDVVSFLFQAKANFSHNFKVEMLNYYYGLWHDDDKVCALKKSLPYLQFIRFLQVLGAYGFRGLVQKKIHFRESFGKGITNLSRFAEDWEGSSDYPALCGIIQQLDTDAVRQKVGVLVQ